MPLFAQKTFKKAETSGYCLDNSNLNKIGNIRISPLKSFAILFLIFAFILPQAAAKISDLNLYFTEFSAVKELAQAADISAEKKKDFSEKPDQEKTEQIKPEQEKKEKPKLKKITLADIWPEDFDADSNSSKIILAAKNGFAGTEKVQNGKFGFADIWPEEAEREAGKPRRLVIPAIKVSANIGSLGIGQDGEMEAPENYLEAGWFNLGSRPGERGNAIIAGHLNNEYGSAGIFWHLDKLKAGDDIYIIDENGKNFHFRVAEKNIYSVSSSLGEIFLGDGKVRLNLITCDGVWDKKTQNYTKRLVVSAELLSE